MTLPRGQGHAVCCLRNEIGDGFPLRGPPPTPVWIRMPMETLFIAWAWIVR